MAPPGGRGMERSLDSTRSHLRGRRALSRGIGARGRRRPTRLGRSGPPYAGGRPPRWPQPAGRRPWPSAHGPGRRCERRTPSPRPSPWSTSSAARRAAAWIRSRSCLASPMVTADISTRTGMCRTWTTTSLKSAARASSAARAIAFLLPSVSSIPTMRDLVIANSIAGGPRASPRLFRLDLIY